MRKLLVFVLIFALLGCSTEQKVDENMKLSDYLERMARGDKLNSMEVQHMKTLADEMDEKVAMWSKDGPNTMTVRNLKAQDAFFTNMPMSFMVMDRQVDLTIPNGSFTSVTDYAEYTPVTGDRVSASNDFFELDTATGKIFVKQPNRVYAFYVYVAWAGNANGHRAARIYQYNGEDDSEITYSVSHRIPPSPDGGTSFATFTFIPWGGERTIGDYLILKLYQTSGGDLDVLSVAFGAFVLR